MWRLITRLRDDESGASAVMVGVMLTVLVGFAGVAVDVGAMYSERAQLQNAADAGALAAAKHCSTNGDCATATQQAGALTAADGRGDGNMADGGATTAITKFTTSTVTVATETPNMAHPLAAMFGFGSSDVGAIATAEWGVPNYGPVIPFVIGSCEVTTARFTSGQEVVIDDVNHTSCGTGGPGGFGWIKDTTAPTNCNTYVAVNGVPWNAIATGQWGSNDTGCDDAKLNSFLCKTILVPVYDQSAGTGNGTTYHIEKFAAFVLDGWRKNPSGSQGGMCSGVTAIYNTKIEPTGSARWATTGIQGHFTQFVSLEDAFKIGPGVPNGGLSVVRLTCSNSPADPCPAP